MGSLPSKVRLNDLRVILDVGGRSFCNLTAVVQDVDPLAKVHYYLHVVLYDDEALALVPKLENKIEELVEQGPVDAGGRLIEEDDLGVEHENPDELKKLLLSVGEVTGELVPEGAEVYEGQQLLSLVAVFSLTTFRSRGNEVLISRKLGKNPIDLKRPADTSPGNLVGLEVRDSLALVIDSASIGPVEAGDEVEEGCLTAAVGPDRAAAAASRQSKEGRVWDAAQTE